MRSVAVILLALVAAALTASTASAGVAVRCTPPKLAGFEVESLRAARIPCTKARTLMRSVVYGTLPRGYTCARQTETPVTRVAVSCSLRSNARHWFTGTYRRR